MLQAARNLTMHYVPQEIDNQDVEAFTEAVKQYDSISRLDSWHTTLLLRVKKNLNSEDDLC